MALILEITVGASCSGKTTYAEARARDKGFININRDDLRMTLFGLKSMHDYKFTKAKETMVTAAQTSIAGSALAEGKSVIISDTNINPGGWELWKAMAKRFNATFVPTYFPVPLSDLLDRNTKRDRSLPIKIIKQQVERFEQNFPDVIDYWLPAKYDFEKHKDLPKAFIVDVDGTLAHMEGKRGPFEWDKVLVDEPDYSVIESVNVLHAAGYEIIILSGRDAVCADDTVEWLKRHGVKFNSIYMRRGGDYRPDTKIKEEIFQARIEGMYNVVGVFDDRNVVVEMWRKKGLKVFQVQEGDF